MGWYYNKKNQLEDFVTLEELVNLEEENTVVTTLENVKELNVMLKEKDASL